MQIISHPLLPSSAHKSNVIIGALIIFIRRVRAHAVAAAAGTILLRPDQLSYVLPPLLSSSIYVDASAAPSPSSYTCTCGQHAQTVARYS